MNLQQDTETVFPPLQADEEEETELYGWISIKTDGYEGVNNNLGLHVRATQVVMYHKPLQGAASRPLKAVDE